MPPFDSEISLTALHRLVANANATLPERPVSSIFRSPGGMPYAYRGFDFSELWVVDTAIAEDIQAFIRPFATHHEYRTAYGLGLQFEGLVADWRPHLLAPAPK
jgi:hypothetical protein